MTSFSYEHTVYEPTTHKLDLHPSRQQAILRHLANVTGGTPIETVQIENIEKEGHVGERHIEVGLGPQGKLVISSDFSVSLDTPPSYRVSQRGPSGKMIWAMSNKTANGTWIGTDYRNEIARDIEDEKWISKVENAVKTVNEIITGGGSLRMNSAPSTRP